MPITPDTLMLFYTLLVDIILAAYVLEVLKRGGASAKLRGLLAVIAFGILAFLTWGVTQKSLFPADVSGIVFFSILIGTVVFVVAAFFMAPALRTPLSKVPQELLLLPQGLRVFFG